jgi:hypothetical protein
MTIYVRASQKIHFMKQQQSWFIFWMLKKADKEDALGDRCSHSIIQGILKNNYIHHWKVQLLNELHIDDTIKMSFVNYPYSKIML